MEANTETKTKVCSHCKRELPVTEFYTSVSTKDGYRPQCKECSKQSSLETAKRRREQNKIAKEAMTELRQDKSYRKLTLAEKKQLLLQVRSDKPLSAYHPRELFEYLASIGYKIQAKYVQELNFG
jgi:hypothetical protein